MLPLEICKNESLQSSLDKSEPNSLLRGKNQVSTCHRIYKSAHSVKGSTLPTDIQ